MATSQPQPNQPKEKFTLIAPPRPNALANLKAGQPKRAKPVDYDEALPRQYNRILQAIITAVNADIKRDILPAIQRAKPEYTADAWPSLMNALLTALAERWSGTLFKSQAQRIAAGTVRRAEAENGKAFLKSVNQAAGVEVFGAHSEALSTELEAAAIENAQLITKMTAEHINRIQTTIMENMRAGYAPSVIARNLQEKSGISRKRAKFIARDQTAKLNGELTKLRNQAAGIEYFRWSTSKDGRVGEDHRRAAERDVGYGPGVYRWDKPPKEGIPGRATRPNCRCSAAPVFEWELPGKD